MGDLRDGSKTKTKNKNTLEYWNDHFCSHIGLHPDQCHPVSRQEKADCLQGDGR